MAQTVKRLPIMWETQVRSLGQEDPLEKEMTTHSSTLAWKIPWMEELVGYSPQGRKESDMTLYFIEKKLFKTFCGYRILELEEFLDCRRPVCD